MSIADELCLEQWEMLEEERGEVTIFSKMQKILHVQRVDPVFGIVFNHLIRYEERFVGIRSPDAIESETTGKTGNGAEQTFERFGHMMRDEVFIHLSLGK